MPCKSENIEELCNELQELGIDLDSRTMKLIVQMQEQDFRNLTKDIDIASEFKNLLSKINNI
jgi:hypothetical protein